VRGVLQSRATYRDDDKEGNEAPNKFSSLWPHPNTGIQLALVTEVQFGRSRTNDVYQHAELADKRTFEHQMQRLSASRLFGDDYMARTSC